jgi:hypothetical protein
MRVLGLRTYFLRAGAVLLFASIPLNRASASQVMFDGFGDGDHNNNGLDSGATATDATDVGVPWYLASGTSAVNFTAIDDSSGIGSGNALQLFNTGSNNRPTAGRFTPQSLNDGDSLILRLDMRVLSVKNTTGTDITGSRAIRFGLYYDKSSATWTSGDKGSSDTTYNDDDGYDVTVDARADVTDTTTMDARKDADDAQILQAAAAGIGASSTNTADQLVDTNKHHFELTLTRSGSNLLVSLQQDSNPTISGTDTSPISGNFTFNEVAIGVRSSAAMDTRWDNIEVDYVPGAPVPEPAGLAATALAGVLVRRRRKLCQV